MGEKTLELLTRKFHKPALNIFSQRASCCRCTAHHQTMSNDTFLSCKYPKVNLRRTFDISVISFRLTLYEDYSTKGGNLNQKKRVALLQGILNIWIRGWNYTGQMKVYIHIQRRLEVSEGQLDQLRIPRHGQISEQSYIHHWNMSI